METLGIVLRDGEGAENLMATLIYMVRDEQRTDLSSFLKINMLLTFFGKKYLVFSKCFHLCCNSS